MNTVVQTWNLLGEPRAVFVWLGQKPRWLFALSLLVGAHLALWYGYYQVVDLDWLRDTVISNNPDLNTAAARAEAAKFMSKSALVSMASMGTLIGMPLMFLIFACYYSLVGKLMNVDKGFSAWFGFVVWTALPSLFLLPVMAAAFWMSGDGRLTPEQMNLLSLNELFWQGQAEAPWKGFLDNINLTTLWSLALAAFGLRVWSGRSWAVCTAVALLPSVCIYGLWLILAVD